MPKASRAELRGFNFLSPQILKSISDRNSNCDLNKIRVLFNLMFIKSISHLLGWNSHGCAELKSDSLHLCS